MANKGRPHKYLTVEEFKKWKENDFYHLCCTVKTNKKLLWIILGSLIGAVLIERIFGAVAYFPIIP